MVDRAVDPEPIHRRHHLVAGGVRGPVGHARPGPLRRVRRRGVDLRVDEGAGATPPGTAQQRRDQGRGQRRPGPEHAAPVDQFLSHVPLQGAWEPEPLFRGVAGHRRGGSPPADGPAGTCGCGGRRAGSCPECPSTDKGLTCALGVGGVHALHRDGVGDAAAHRRAAPGSASGNCARNRATRCRRNRRGRRCTCWSGTYRPSPW